jgi:5'-3' exonuclease
MTEGRLMLLDTAALYFRAFYGLPDTLKAKDGTPVNAVRGLLDIIAKLVTEYRPAELVACWDVDWRPQWRVDLVPTYKTHRVAEVVEVGPDVEVVPDPLSVQVPIIVQTLEALGIPIVGKAEYEADDIIGSLAAQASRPVDVVTGDRDLFQVIDDDRDVRVIYTARGMSNLEVVTDEVMRAKYNISARQYADYATLRGDASDGLPGVQGVGEKTAAALLTEFGDLAGIVAAADSGIGVKMTPSVKAKIRAGSDYLAKAPTVVAVARDLELPTVDARIGIPSGGVAEIERLGAQWNLGSSVGRVVAALGERED